MSSSYYRTDDYSKVSKWGGTEKVTDAPSVFSGGVMEAEDF